MTLSSPVALKIAPCLLCLGAKKTSIAFCSGGSGEAVEEGGRPVPGRVRWSPLGA